MTQPIAPPAPLIRVCAWHTSPAERETLNRQHPGRVTHGICESCQAQFLREVR